MSYTLHTNSNDLESDGYGFVLPVKANKRNCVRNWLIGIGVAALVLFGIVAIASFAGRDASIAPESIAKHATVYMEVAPPKSKTGIAVFEEVTGLSVDKLMSATTESFLAVLGCAGSTCAGDQYLKIARDGILSAAGMIPYVGPLLKGIVGMLWQLPTTSLWDQIKDAVDIAIGQAIRESRIDWVDQDLTAIRQSVAEYAAHEDCDSGLPERPAVLDLLGQLASHIETGFADGEKFVVGGTKDKGATQRAMLAFLPETALLAIMVRANMLELLWTQTSTKGLHARACQNMLDMFRSVIDDHIKFASKAIDNLIEWQAGNDCEGDRCLPGRFRSKYLKESYGISKATDYYWRCGLDGEELKEHCQLRNCKKCEEYGTRTVKPNPRAKARTETYCVRYNPKKRNELFEETCIARKAAYLTERRNWWNGRLLNPLHKWRAMSNSLDGYGYCAQMEDRAVEGVRERMGMKSFILSHFPEDYKNSGCVPGEPKSACWRRLDQYSNCTRLDIHPAADTSGSTSDIQDMVEHMSNQLSHLSQSDDELKQQISQIFTRLDALEKGSIQHI